MRFHSGMAKLRSALSRVVLPLILSIFFNVGAASAVDGGKYLVYIGTYTLGTDGQEQAKNTGSKGIYVYRYDAETGDIAPLGVAGETTNPSWVTVAPNGRFLYAVNEVGNFRGPNSGGVSAFAIDRKTGKLMFLNEVASRGADPCYVAVDKSGKFVLVANYTGGSVAVFPILADGQLGEASDFIQHTGHGADPQRQEGPHAHFIDLSPDNRLAFVDDLGLDELLAYKFDNTKGTLTPNDPPFTKLDPAGSGPRHFALHPSGKFAYVISEMAGTVTVFSSDLAAGTFRQKQVISTLPAGYKGPKEDAEIEIAPSGKFLYASNRGDANSIAVFRINQQDGELSLIEIVPTEGKTPRSFAIDPSGKSLLVANENSDNIVAFRIDQKTGRLTSTGKVMHVPAPVCVKFLKID